MKQTKPKPAKLETTPISIARLKVLERSNHQMLQISAHVWRYSEAGDDDTVDCVFRILEGYHSAKAEVYELLRKAK